MSDDVVFDPISQDTTDTRRQSWARWMPEPIHEAPPPPPPESQAVPAPESKLRLKNTLVRLRKQAQEEGYNEGYAAGHTEGLEQGQADGHKLGHQDGYRTGFEAGHTEGREQAEHAAERLTALTQQCATALSEIEADVGQALINLSVRIAEQVLHRTLKTEPETILALVDDILRLDTGKSAVLQLYVNPDDLTLVHDYLQGNPDTSMWRVLADDTITRGGCKARTALGDIDATVEKRWQRVVSTIGGSL